MTTHKWVYLFSKDVTEGNKDMKNLLGGKGANLAEMCSLKLAVPPGFTVTTEACLDYEKNKRVINDEIRGPIIIFCALWSKSFNAGDDGYSFKPWIK
jgi:pyruvate,orthophosphate dikinase